MPEKKARIEAFFVTACCARGARLPTVTIGPMQDIIGTRPQSRLWRFPKGHKAASSNIYTRCKMCTRCNYKSQDADAPMAAHRCQQVEKPRGANRDRTSWADWLTIGATVALVALTAAGCAVAPLDRAGSLQAYDDLTPSDGLVTRTLQKVAKDDVLAAKTVKIVPTAFSDAAGDGPFTPAQRSLVANAADRALCAGLAGRFEVVGPARPADLTVHAVVTHAAATDPVAVGFSKGASVAKTVLLPGVPVPVPRIPIGLGSLSLEAEARDVKGRQEAAMIWGRAANALTDSGRVAENGDAYTLAAAFGDHFSKLL